jgi:hypothetical protein
LSLAEAVGHGCLRSLDGSGGTAAIFVDLRSMALAARTSRHKTEPPRRVHARNPYPWGPIQEGTRLCRPTHAMQPVTVGSRPNSSPGSIAVAKVAGCDLPEPNRLRAPDTTRRPTRAVHQGTHLHGAWVRYGPVHLQRRDLLLEPSGNQAGSRRTTTQAPVMTRAASACPRAARHGQRRSGLLRVQGRS